MLNETERLKEKKSKLKLAVGELAILKKIIITISLIIGLNQIDNPIIMR